MSAVVDAIERPVAVYTEETESPPLTVIEPRSGWRFVDLPELWRHRELLAFLIWRDVKVRYKQTVLGAAWAIIQPLATMLVFTLFLGRVARAPTATCPIRFSSLPACYRGRSSPMPSPRREPASSAIRT